MMRHSFKQVTSHVRNLSILTPVRPTCVVLKGKVVCEMNTVSQWRRWYGSESGGLTEEALNLETVGVLKLFDKVDPNKVILNLKECYVYFCAVSELLLYRLTLLLLLLLLFSQKAIVHARSCLSRCRKKFMATHKGYSRSVPNFLYYM